MQEARTQYERASDELKDEALEEYSRVLKVFTDLVIRGWLPRAPSR